MRLVFKRSNQLLKKANWLILLGSAIVLFGALNFWLYYHKNAPSPFDIVDDETETSGFIPIL
ncbi:MAG: hypothetical protein HY781_13055, partial [Chloroflexi bacterium]|nr:hypothetical protein [Chloroflexota bacterium]